MQVIRYTVNPQIPKPLEPLQELARNLWTSWNYDATNLFIRLDYDAWLESGQNPVRVLGMVSQDRYEKLASDDSYMAALTSVYKRFQDYQSANTWYDGDRSNVIAYFSMEFGLDVSLPIYSGGLGVLAGDHLKSSSDLGLPLVGVGLLYRQGYFQQYLNADGFQQESYPENDWYNMPVRRCENAEHEPIRISVKIGEATVVAQIWEVRIGRISLYLLDTNIDENSPENKTITATLYGGNKETRIRQEILLGIGGIRALRALGISPGVTHMNEGHSAFLGIERIREYVTSHGMSFKEAIQAIWPTNVFTTHTPVPAGNERFSVELMQKYYSCITEGIDIPWHDFMALGRENPDDHQEHFCMTVLALKLSAYSNGVSALHGEVSRDMWKSVWPEVPVREVPIRSITNGVHPRTFIAPDTLDLLDRYFGPRFYDEPAYLEIWDRMDRISHEELWRTHERRKERLVVFTRERLRKQLAGRGATGSQLIQAEEVLSPYTLTISFARRFATYKRATLLFRDPERLMRMLSDTERPIQLIFAGKAHPHDIPGKNLIKDIVHFASQPEVRSKIVFLENYDLNIAKHLVSGSDLWLNTPRRPMEASGTSGMKAVMNGVLNCSVLDGWWAEAYSPDIGWAIGNGELYDDPEMQDEIESKALYDLLEREIIPLYYDRGRDGLPRGWINMQKASMKEMGRRFSCHRMIMEYADHFYIPALENYRNLEKSKFTNAKKEAEYLESLVHNWDSVWISDIARDGKPVMNIGDTMRVTATVNLGGLSPEDVSVEVYYGSLGSKGDFEEPARAEMQAGKASSDGSRTYSIDVTCNQSGQQGISVRVLPKAGRLVHQFVPGVIRWA